MKAIARETTVTTDRETRRLATDLEHPSEPAANTLCQLVGEIAVGDATDVVLAENVRRDGHGGSFAGFPTGVKPW